MEVSIPLIQNQVIDHTGTYHIVQRTINGQTGLVIEEYIPEPEPEPEEEVLQNNSNTRAMIIDDEYENNNNGQIILRGQNNVRGLPDPTGEAIEGTFEINISPTPSKINIKYFSFSSNSLLPLSNFTKATEYITVTIPQSKSLIRIITDNSNSFTLYYTSNNSSNSIRRNVLANQYYYLVDSVSYTDFYDENNSKIIRLYDKNLTDDFDTELNLYKSFFDFIFD